MASITATAPRTVTPVERQKALYTKAAAEFDAMVKNADGLREAWKQAKAAGDHGKMAELRAKGEWQDRQITDKAKSIISMITKFAGENGKEVTIPEKFTAVL